MTRDELLNTAHEAGFVVNFKDARIGIQNGFFVKDCTSEFDRFAALVAKATATHPAAAQDDSGAMRLGRLWSQARSVHPDDPARQNASFLAALGVFESLANATERAARIAAQTENEALKARLAASGVTERRAVREAVLKERDECASIAETGFRFALDGDRIGDLIRDRSK